jgi:hypothetical protein
MVNNRSEFILVQATASGGQTCGDVKVAWNDGHPPAPQRELNAVDAGPSQVPLPGETIKVNVL